MKRPVSLVASLLVASAMSATFALAGCGAAPAGKAEFASVCLDRMGNKKEKCSCYVDTIEKELSPEQFAAVAQGALENRRMSSMLPESLMSQTAVSEAVLSATTQCFAASPTVASATG
jgi:hypothetical protein